MDRSNPTTSAFSAVHRSGLQWPVVLSAPVWPRLIARFERNPADREAAPLLAAWSASAGSADEEPTPGRPKAPRWLWIAAAAAVVLVTALVIALVIANGTARRQTAVPPLPAMPSSQNPVPTSTSPSPSASTSEPTTTETSQPANASAMQTVSYNVTGEGRAISITYVDNDGMMQTEFNVALPWSKEVSLSTSGSPEAQCHHREYRPRRHVFGDGGRRSGQAAHRRRADGVQRVGLSQLNRRLPRGFGAGHAPSARPAARRP